MCLPTSKSVIVMPLASPLGPVSQRQTSVCRVTQDAHLGSGPQLNCLTRSNSSTPMQTNQPPMHPEWRYLQG